MKLKKIAVVAGTVLALSTVLYGCGGTKAPTGNQNQADKAVYPQKTINIVHILDQKAPPAALAKAITDSMSKSTGWKFEYSYAPENMGSDAANKVLNAPHDGYTVLAQTENMLQYSVRDLTKQTAKDWKFFEAFQERSAVAVYKGSAFKTFDDLMKAAKANPGKIKVGHPATGSSFDMKLYALEKVAGVKFEHVELHGGPDFIKAMQEKRVDAVIAPLVILMDGISKSNVIPIAMSDTETFDFEGAVGKVESIGSAYPEYKKYLPLDAIIGFAMPADAPKEVVDAFGKAFEEAVNSPEVGDIIAKLNGIKVNIWGDNAADYMLKMESNYTWLVKEAGFSKVDPETLGIPKP